MLMPLSVLANDISKALNMINIISKSTDRQMSDHFHSSEFVCRCNNLDCDYTLISKDLILKLERLREIVGHPIEINSAFRCSRHNKASGGVMLSQHQTGQGADLRCPNELDFEDFVLYIKSMNFGFIKVYKNKNFVHVDTRS